MSWSIWCMSVQEIQLLIGNNEHSKFPLYLSSLAYFCLSKTIIDFSLSIWYLILRKYPHRQLAMKLLIWYSIITLRFQICSVFKRGISVLSSLCHQLSLDCTHKRLSIPKKFTFTGLKILLLTFWSYMLNECIPQEKYLAKYFWKMASDEITTISSSQLMIRSYYISFLQIKIFTLWFIVWFTNVTSIYCVIFVRFVN